MLSGCGRRSAAMLLAVVGVLLQCSWLWSAFCRNALGTMLVTEIAESQNLASQSMERLVNRATWHFSPLESSRSEMTIYHPNDHDHLHSTVSSAPSYKESQVSNGREGSRVSCSIGLTSGLSPLDSTIGGRYRSSLTRKLKW